MLELTRKGAEVYAGKTKLTIVAQATKGPGKEVVKIAGLEGSNGQKWVSLSTLKEGLNKVETKAREVANSGSRSYVFTKEEAEKVAKLQAEIATIVEAAKARYVAKPKLDVDPSKMTEKERQAKIEEIKKFYNLN